MPQALHVCLLSCRKASDRRPMVRTGCDRSQKPLSLDPLLVSRTQISPWPLELASSWDSWWAPCGSLDSRNGNSGLGNLKGGQCMLFIKELIDLQRA